MKQIVCDFSWFCSFQLNTDLKLDDAIVINDLIDFVSNFKDELWVVGGATIYKLTLPYADRLYISFVNIPYLFNTI